MKAKKTLCIALGLASSAMLAQAQTSTGPDTSNQYQGQTQPAPQTPASGATAPTYPQQQGTPQSGDMSQPADTSQQQATPQPPPTSDTPQPQGATPMGNAPEQQSTPTTGDTTQQQAAPSSGTPPQQVTPSPAPSSSGSSDSSAQPSSASATGNVAAPVVQLQPKTENGVTYLCGGIGLDEAQMIKSEARNYDLMLTFAERNGNYLADVNVEIADAHGAPVLKTTCGAPILLVDLPKSGNYRIRSETAGHTVTRTAYVQNKKGHFKSLALVWPQVDTTASTGTSSGSSTGSSAGSSAGPSATD